MPASRRRAAAFATALEAGAVFGRDFAALFQCGSSGVSTGRRGRTPQRYSSLWARAPKWRAFQIVLRTPRPAPVCRSQGRLQLVDRTLLKAACARRPSVSRAASSMILRKLYPHRRELLADLGHNRLVDADEEGLITAAYESAPRRRARWALLPSRRWRRPPLAA